MTEERRQHKRVAFPFDASWTGASGAARCRTVDVSLGGCYLYSRSSPAIGEETTVTLERSDKSITLRGRVVQVESGMGFAVQFVDVSDTDLQQLKELITAVDTGNTGS